MSSLAIATQLDLNLHFLFGASSGDRLRSRDHHLEPGTGLVTQRCPPDPGSLCR